MKHLLRTSLFAIALSAVTTSNAVPLTYTLGGDSSVAANTGAGLIIETALSPNLAGTSFSLDDGNSWTFDFFKIWTDEPRVDQDDKNPVQITATLEFGAPNTEAAVNGLTYAVSVFNGAGQYGEVAWGNPAPTFTLGDRVFQVSLSNVQFNRGFNIGGLASGQGFGAMVQATVTQISSSATPPPVSQVPDHGNTAILLGLAVMGVVVIRRRQLAV